MRAKILVAVALVVVSGMAAAEDPKSANYIMPGCRAFIAKDTKVADLMDKGRCVGILEGLNYMDNKSCPPAGGTHGQLMRVVVKYIDERPQRMHEEFATLALEAMRKAWPCR